MLRRFQQKATDGCCISTINDELCRHCKVAESTRPIGSPVANRQDLAQQMSEDNIIAVLPKISI